MPPMYVTYVFSAIVRSTSAIVDNMDFDRKYALCSGFGSRLEELNFNSRTHKTLIIIF